MKSGRTSLTVVAVVGAVLAAGATATSATAATPKRQIAKSQPDWVSRTKSTGKATPGGRSTFTVYLSPRGGAAALKAAADAISTPGSASYRKFLTAQQFHARFDPTKASVDQVTRWLGDNGLKVLSTDPYRRSVRVTGTNAAVGKAFSTEIRRFKNAGQDVQANTTSLSVPADLSQVISGVEGLDTTARLIKPAPRPQAAPGGFRNAPPCSSYYGEKIATTLPKYEGQRLPYAVCGYTGSQYRSAYTGNTSLDGTGVTVAITDAYASPTIAADASKYAARNGDQAYRPGQLTQSLPKNDFRKRRLCDETGWYGEESLDIEAVHAVAQNANIKYYGARSCEDADFIVTLQKVVDDNQASLVSNSWGQPELTSSATLAQQYTQIYQQAAIQGIAFLFSSGDSGDEVANTGVKQADSEATNPYVTAVGGTSDAIGSTGQFLFQTGWGTHRLLLNSAGTKWTPNSDSAFLYGAGGGVSVRFPQPDYQRGVVPGRFSSGRAVPDVAMDGDPNTGMLIGLTQEFPDGTKYGEYRIGGTSLASPLFAGLTALRQQAKGTATGDRLGFLNPSIYANRSVFTDVKGQPSDPGNVRVDYVNGINDSNGLRPSVRTFNQDSSLTVEPGWDEVTGVGAGNARWITAP